MTPRGHIVKLKVMQFLFLIPAKAGKELTSTKCESEAVIQKIRSGNGLWN
ncbi:MAG: hypothetical protein ACYCSQ_02055 [bacterium]